MKLGRPVDQGRSTVLGNELAIFATVPAIEKLAGISFFSIMRLGNLADTVPDLLGYIRTSKTHSKYQKKHTIEERIEGRKRSSNLVSKFYTFLCNFCLC